MPGTHYTGLTLPKRTSPSLSGAQGEARKSTG